MSLQNPSKKIPEKTHPYNLYKPKKKEEKSKYSTFQM